VQKVCLTACLLAVSLLPGPPSPAALRQVHAAEPGLVVMPNGATNWGPTEVLLTAQVRGRAASRAGAPCMDMLWLCTAHAHPCEP